MILAATNVAKNKHDCLISNSHGKILVNVVRNNSTYNALWVSSDILHYDVCRILMLCRL